MAHTYIRTLYCMYMYAYPCKHKIYHNLSQDGWISIIFRYFESPQKTLSDGVFSSNFSKKPDFDNFTQLYMSWFLPKMGPKLILHFLMPYKRAYFMLPEKLRNWAVQTRVTMIQRGSFMTLPATSWILALLMVTTNSL